jgi:non-specific serine/threonine protein kinase
MQAPNYQKFIFNHANDMVLSKGKRILAQKGVSKKQIDTISQYAQLWVKSEQYKLSYKVNIYNFLDEDKINLRCQCPYDMGDICKHEVAALLYLQEELTKENTVKNLQLLG